MLIELKPHCLLNIHVKEQMFYSSPLLANKMVGEGMSNSKQGKNQICLQIDSIEHFCVNCIFCKSIIPKKKYPKM